MPLNHTASFATIVAMMTFPVTFQWTGALYPFYRWKNQGTERLENGSLCYRVSQALGLV